MYLSQCEQIIGSLKELTNKSSRKIREKTSKYDMEEPIDKYLMSNRYKRRPYYNPNYKSYLRNNTQTPTYGQHGSSAVWAKTKL